MLKFDLETVNNKKIIIMVVKVGVIGAGPVGLSSAIQIAEKYKSAVNVTILTDDITPNTTGDGSAGLWTVYFIVGPGNDKKKLCEWGQASFAEYHRLWKTGLCDESGVMLLPVFHLSEEEEPMDAFCKDIVYGYTFLTPNEVTEYSLEFGNEYKSGSRSIVFACEVRKYLPFLMKRFQNAGGNLKEQHINSFEDICTEYDVIVNCAGICARELTKDPKITPIRGQSMRVEAPWIFHCTIDDIRMNQFVPNLDSVFLGGTAQYGNYNKNVDAKDSKHIREGSIELCKSLENSKILWEWAGLRPGRDSVRLEVETYTLQSGKIIPIVHNYGHGGSGVTLSWGCGRDVAVIVKELFNELC